MGISMLKKITHALMALMLALGFAMSSAHDAEARRGGGVALGVAAGIIGLGFLAPAPAATAITRITMTAATAIAVRASVIGRAGAALKTNMATLVCRGGRYLCERAVVCD